MEIKEVIELYDVFQSIKRALEGEWVPEAEIDPDRGVLKDMVFTTR